jgi:hypothetical protein
MYLYCSRAGGKPCLTASREHQTHPRYKERNEESPSEVRRGGCNFDLMSVFIVKQNFLFAHPILHHAKMLTQ